MLCSLYSMSPNQGRIWGWSEEARGRHFFFEILYYFYRIPGKIKSIYIAGKCSGHPFLNFLAYIQIHIFKQKNKQPESEDRWPQQCLDLQADYSMVDGAVNMATAATQGFQLWHTWSDLSSITKGIGVASVAAFMGLAFANYKMYQLSQDALIDLRKNLIDVNRLQNILQDLHDQAAQVVKEMED